MAARLQGGHVNAQPLTAETVHTQPDAPLLADTGAEQLPRREGELALASGPASFQLQVS